MNNWRWILLSTIILVPLVIAARSPLLAWREPIYIAAGFAGVFAFSLLLIQPLLVGGHLPGLHALKGRRVHRWLGILLVAAVLVHVAGLWITSPPDVIDALLFRSPTPFSLWGVIGMWTVFAAALLAVFRRKLPVSARIWRFAHTSITSCVAATSVAHALMIQGTMGLVSKTILSVVIVTVTLAVVIQLGSWKNIRLKTR